MIKRIAIVLAIGTAAASGAAATLRVDATRVVREMDRHDLLGVNAGLWHEARQLFDTDVRGYLRDLNPAYLRIPGGSWSDQYVWNGNGVWDGNKFDLAKWKDGRWQIDWSGYSPGFRQKSIGQPDTWHGNVDILTLHEWVKDKGAHAIVTVNAGSGTPEMAAEWVRWANLKQGYGVRYWEVGNELEGGWEMGNTLPDGRKMTGGIYAQKFIEFARAMKAVDPTIKVGGPAAANTRAVFVEDLLRLAGDQVDFISFHTYPVERQLAGDADIIKGAFSLREPMQRLRGLIAQYQPKRANSIEISITEWNSKVLEDRMSGDLMNGLWSALFVGEMFRDGVTFATQWDLLTMKDEGGHGMFQFADGVCLPKSQYWGLYLWSKHMGDQLLASRVEGAENVFCVVTRDSDRLFVLAVNVSRDRSAQLELDVPGVAFAPEGRMATLSHREYFWNPYDHRPKWSRKPQEAACAINGALEVPPYSARVFELPMKGKSLRSAAASSRAAAEGLEVLLPKTSMADQPVEGWVLLPNAKGLPEATEATLTVTGPATVDKPGVRLAESAGRFFLRPVGAGAVTVRAEAGALSATGRVEIHAVKERKEIVWRFDGAPAKWNAVTSYKLAGDDTARPNQQVAAVVLDGALPDEGNDKLAVFSIPATLPKERIGGVVLDVGASADFECADKRVGARVVLQSEQDHWIELGSVRLNDVRGKWQTLELRLPSPDYYSAMGKTYALFIQLYQDGAKKVPVTGKVYLDNVGFILR